MKWWKCCWTSSDGLDPLARQFARNGSPHGGESGFDSPGVSRIVRKQTGLMEVMSNKTNENARQRNRT